MRMRSGVKAPADPPNGKRKPAAAPDYFALPSFQRQQAREPANPLKKHAAKLAALDRLRD
jgi:hypothetical protein